LYEPIATIVKKRPDKLTGVKISLKMVVERITITTSLNMPQIDKVTTEVL
jgi:hypothetical protein